MTTEEAILTEIRRYAEACANHDTHKAHIHRLALNRLRNRR